MQKQVQTFAVGLFVLGVGEAFKLKRLLKKEKKTEKFGQTEVGGHSPPSPSPGGGWGGALTPGRRPSASPRPREAWNRPWSFSPPRR